MVESEYSKLKTQLSVMLDQRTSEFFIAPPGMFDKAELARFRGFDTGRVASVRFIHGWHRTRNDVDIYVLATPMRTEEPGTRLRPAQIRLDTPTEVWDFVKRELDALIQHRAAILAARSNN
jgi:hypothetical protein